MNSIQSNDLSGGVSLGGHKSGIENSPMNLEGPLSQGIAGLNIPVGIASATKPSQLLKAAGSGYA